VNDPPPQGLTGFLERHLKIDVFAVLGSIGLVLVVMGLAQLVPWAVDLAVGNPAWELLLAAMATTLLGGGLLRLKARGRKWTRRESLAIVAYAWIAALLAGTLPFLVLGSCDFVDALVESASGLTTTGATIFPDVDHMATASGVPPEHPEALHMWRALLHWLGGAGIVLIVLVLTPWLGGGEEAESLRRTQRSEASFLTERYRGSTKATLKGLLTVYVGATLLEVVLLLLLGVSLWDAVIHSFATISTGGFSNTTASLGAWGNAVQLCVLSFMILGALNFAVLGRVMDELQNRFRRTRREAGLTQAVRDIGLRAAPLSLRTLWRSGEVRGYLLLLAGCTVVITGFLFASGDRARYLDEGPAGLGQALVDAAFTVGSISTTTGFCTEDYTAWPPACKFVLLGLMIIGGCSGSTAGGIKFRRLAILLKYMLRELKRLPRPQAVIPLRLGDSVISDEQLREALGYVTTYCILVGLLGAVLGATGSDPVSSASAAVSSFGSIGPAFGDCGPSGSFQPYARSAKLLCVLAMVLGRLEIFAFLTVLLPSFWLRRLRPRGPLPTTSPQMERERRATWHTRD
jgi:trk/ktr system potassium uptake protein